nr:hypothetical protein [uncultured Nocardioides sp.]
MLDDGSKVPLARWVTVLIGVLCLLCPWSSSAGLSFVYCTALLGLAVLLVLTLRSPRGIGLSATPLVWLMAGATVAGVVLTAGVAVAEGASAGLVLLAAVPAMVVGVGVITARIRPTRPALALLAAGGAVLVAALIAVWAQPIDVELFTSGGLDALSRGSSPYAITIDDVYPAAESARVYGDGVVEGGQVQYGYPYLPAGLLMDLPAHLVADAVWMHAAWIAVAVVLGWRIARDVLGRAAVIVLALGPATPVLIVNYWIEAPMIGFFAVAWWGMQRHRRSIAAIAIGALFASKQYSAFFLASLWPVLRSMGAAVVAGAAAVGIAIVVGVLLMEPAAFYRSAVQLQLVQPFREDAVSLLPALQAVAGGLPSWLTVAAPFGGFAVSAFVARWTRPGSTSFALCVGLGLLVTVIFARQAFVNYYAFIGAVLLLAGVSWPQDDPTQMREPSSQGSRGDLGITRTR